jgi:hypothetical protein
VLVLLSISLIYHVHANVYRVCCLTLRRGCYCYYNYYCQNGDGRITARELYKGLEDLGILDVLSRDELEGAMEVRYVLYTV